MKTLIFLLAMIPAMCTGQSVFDTEILSQVISITTTADTIKTYFYPSRETITPAMPVIYHIDLKVLRPYDVVIFIIGNDTIYKKLNN